MDSEYRNKINKIAKKMGIKIVPVKNLNDIYTKCDGFTMITDYSSRFKNKEIKIRENELE